MGRTACTEPQCLYKGALYLTVEIYLYSPYEPYGLYRASVPVQEYTLSALDYVECMGRTLGRFYQCSTRVKSFGNYLGTF